jgi:5,10-methylenetetrahydromethanopterin reductase
MEFWRNVTSSPRHAIRFATEAEANGWDGIGVVDSQNLAGDCWVALTAMAGATTTLKLGTGVTNPVTRHPATTASAAHALNMLSPAPDGSGRVALGIGRGDSALAHLGRAPASVKTLERYLAALRGYLSGDGLEFSELDFHESMAPDVSTLGLSDTPGRSQLSWRRDGDPIVPVEVASSGPRVIAAAAVGADRVLFAIGADLTRLRWGIDVARQARADAGMDPESLRFGAYVNVVPHPDAEVAVEMSRGSLTTFARFSVMHGTVQGPVSDHQREVMEQLHGAYNMKQHTMSGSEQTRILTPQFIDDYAAVGTVDRCVEKLRDIEALGIDKVIVAGPSSGSDRQSATESHRLMTEQVIPTVKALA